MARGEHDLRAQQVHSGAGQFIQRSCLRHRQQAERGIGRAGLVLGLRRGQRPLGAVGRVEGEPGRLLEKRGRRRQATAAPGPARAQLKLGRDRLIGTRRRLRPVPGPPVGVNRRVGRVGQRAVQFPPRFDRCRSIGGRTHQRVPEPHPPAELRQSRLRGRPGRPGADRQPPGRPPHQHRIAGGVGRRQLHQPAGLSRQRRQLAREALLDPAVKRCRAAEPEPARQLRWGQTPRQLKQRQRVPVGVGDDLVPDLLVQRAGEHRRQQFPRVFIGQPADHELRQPGDVLARNPGREYQPDRLGRQPPGGESKRLRRGTVQPLLVVNHADQRAFTGCLRHQADNGQADQEAVRHGAGAQTQRGPQRIPLRSRKRIGQLQHGRAELVQAREGQLHFRLHAGRAGDQAAGGPPGQVVEQHGLANPGLTAHHQRPALSGPHVSDEPIEHAAFAEPVHQPAGGSPGA
jgi:hypothetical protein